MSRAYRITRAIGLIVAGVVLSACVLILIGAHFYGLPLVSPIGSTILSLFGPWLIALPVAIGALLGWAWRASHSRSTLVLTLVAAAVTVGSALTVTRMVIEAHHHGVKINLVRAFGMRVMPAWQPDDDFVFGTWQVQPLHLVVYRPSNATPGQAAPVLLYIHGGGWSFGDRFESGTNPPLVRRSRVAGSFNGLHTFVRQSTSVGHHDESGSLRDGVDRCQCGPARRRPGAHFSPGVLRGRQSCDQCRLPRELGPA